MSGGAYEVYNSIKNSFTNYIKAQYFANSQLLLNAVDRNMKSLYREPYIESTPAYETVADGIAKAKLPDWMKNFFYDLIAANLGVYESPYKHQVQSLELAVQGKDLLVSTGTGSGKTECFMWPLVAKLAGEAKNAPDTWKKRGVRVIIMYPMNALVSDQISRLRKLIGDEEHKFADAFRKVAGSEIRRPQFGMYTGRTPYPGKQPKTETDRKLEKTLKKVCKPESQKELIIYNQLLKQGKIPAVKNMEEFLQRLHQDDHAPDAEDAELVTRFEMQKCCPDILVTNYSMLEYMLFRPREEKIWSSTKQWLDASSENRILFIIDEAHMYRGSAGGEVSLLIRRLFHKLRISRERVQFILTTASMPNETDADKDSVHSFAQALTAANSDHFAYITGRMEKFVSNAPIEIPLERFDKFDIDKFEHSDEEKLGELNAFFDGIWNQNGKIKRLVDFQKWLYDHLLEYKEFNHAISLCREKAVSLNEIAKNVFGKDDLTALNAVSVILTIAPFAKDTDGRVLFPARMHMFFRGTTGIYACMNEQCTQKHTGDGITLGDVFFTNTNEKCPHCQSAVYELYNDRRCGALYIKGYISYRDLQNHKQTYLWQDAGAANAMLNDADDKVKEIYLYIPPKDFKLDTKCKRGKGKLYPCYMDTKSGFISFEPTDNLEIRKLYYCNYSDKNQSNLITFVTCPKCESQFKSTKITSFKVHGNEPFYSIVQEQFKAEPPVLGKDADLDHTPNQGRKVLAFSDSRQRAAKLARDMSDISDDRVARQLFVLALKDMNANGQKSLDSVYGYFALEAAKHHVQMFHKKSGADGISNDERKIFKENCETIYNSAFIRKEMGIAFSPDKSLNEAPPSMQEQILKMYCSPYRSLTDIAVSWLSPSDDILCEVLYKIKHGLGRDVSQKEFCEVFNAFMILACGEKAALGNAIDDIVRKNVRTLFDKGEGFGFQPNWDFSKVINDIMGWDDDEKEKWKAVFHGSFLSCGNRNSDRYYIDLTAVTPKLSITDTWYRCRKCSRITRFKLKGHCPRCGSADINELTEDEKKAMAFWRQPLSDALHGEAIRSIDTEEHTAQLSHKDQRDNMWAQTEQYEMRFQDICQEDEQPVDILSSTTTMEVGIDIGSLVAVAMRNVPPTRANYQQRAGRAGRRGASLSTIVTYCEDSPNDMRCFQEPEIIVRGSPNRPWIDTKSTKLAVRHLSMIAIETYLYERNAQKNMDEVSACEFLDQLNNFKNYLSSFEFHREDNLVPKSQSDDALNKYKEKLMIDLALLKLKCEAHPELYEDDEGSRNPKSLLDALYEEGIIPTYSFPKNVVSVYIQNRDGKLQYQVDRSMDVAINEYAPGRSIVVDKVTYQIAGLYNPSSEMHGMNSYSPAKKYIDDDNYNKKNLKRCSRCGWFGFSEKDTDPCPFCGSVTEKMIPMVVPWGFAPKSKNIPAMIQADDIYSKANVPLYSTIPENKDVQDVPSCKKIRMAVRSDQQIIVLNCGPDGKSGFTICHDCGATIPGNDSSLMAKVDRPYPFKGRKCRHTHCENVNLGFDFKTDMFVIEFSIDKQIDTWHWLKQAALSLSEALRIEAASELDIDFAELVSGYRIRRNEAETFADIYFYDDLSSGAGYSTGLGKILPQLIRDTEDFLNACECDTACYNCLKHYGNQGVHGQLDRHAALQLLRYGRDGTISAPLPVEEQLNLLNPVKNILQTQGISVASSDLQITVKSEKSQKQLVIYPYMWIHKNETGSEIYVSDAELKFAKPNAVEHIKNNL